MDKKGPKISTIIICYNAAKHLERTFKCLDAQTYRNFEVIVINDGSKDNTQEVAERLCSERENCAVYSYENGGSAEARNRGITHTTGDYIHFLDADDWFYPTMYERMVNMIIDNDMPDAVRVGYKWEYNFDINSIPELKDDGKDIVVNGLCDVIDKLAKPTVGISTDDVTNYYKTGIMPWNISCTPVWNFLHKRLVVVDNNLRFKKGMKVGDDRLFNVEFFAFANKVAFTDSEYYLYLNTPEGLISTMSSNPNRMYEDKLRYLIERENLRQFYLQKHSIDLFPSYRGSNIMACFQLASILVNLPYSEGKSKYLDFVNHPLMKESLDGFPTKGAPLKMKVPLLMLQHGMKGTFFNLVWLASKMGIRFNNL